MTLIIHFCANSIHLSCFPSKVSSYIRLWLLSSFNSLQ